MTRETKLNLVFLVVICGLTLPGAALLFKKKLDPAEPPMYLPHPVRKSIAFNDPRFAPPQVERVYGPVTRNWIAGLADATSLEPCLTLSRDDDRIRLTATGLAGATWRLQRSTDLIHWVGVGFIRLQGQNVALHLPDPPSNRFYRIVLE